MNESQFSSIISATDTKCSYANITSPINEISGPKTLMSRQPGLLAPYVNVLLKDMTKPTMVNKEWSPP